MTPNGVIFLFFSFLSCGSGSGLIAGLRLGYNVAGFDIKEAQVNAAKARIQKFS